MENDEAKTPARKFRFTQKALAAISPPAANRTYYYDDRTPGLAFCVTHTGHRMFYYVRKIAGQPTRIRLGGFPEITVDQARTLADRKSGDIANGRDPRTDRRAAREESTFGQLFGWYLDSHAKVRKKSWIEDERQYELYLKDWKSRRLSAIDRQAVAQRRAKIGREHGPYAANRTLAMLKTIFNKAIEAGTLKENPATRIKRFPEVQRERFLEPDELPRFFKAVEEEQNPDFRDFFKLCLFSGARRSNVQAMRWEQIDFDRSIWEVPTTKNGLPQSIHLSSEAIDVLRGRLATRTASPWVFPSHGKAGHLIEPKVAWKRVLERASIKDLRLHDLRRTLGSWQLMCGASLPVIGKSLCHKSQAATAVYARMNLATVRTSVNQATAAMLAAGKTTPQATNNDSQP